MSSGRGFRPLIGCCWRRSAAYCREMPGERSWSARRRCCAGTGGWSPAAGPCGCRELRSGFRPRSIPALLGYPVHAASQSSAPTVLLHARARTPDCLERGNVDGLAARRVSVTRGAAGYAAILYSRSKPPSRSRRRRRSSGTTMRIRPAAGDLLAMPARNGRWRHEQRHLPRPTRQYTAEGSQQRPISWRQRGTSDLTLQHPQLMPQQQDLDLLLPLRAPPKHHQLEQSAQ
jgi:hypothetical protein